jgi:hypothetical protein
LQEEEVEEVDEQEHSVAEKEDEQQELQAPPKTPSR